MHPDKPVEVSMNSIHNTEITVTGTRSPSIEAFETSSKILSKCIVDLTPLLTETYPMTSFDIPLLVRTYLYNVVLVSILSYLYNQSTSFIPGVLAFGFVMAPPPIAVCKTFPARTATVQGKNSLSPGPSRDHPGPDAENRGRRSKRTQGHGAPRAGR